MLSGITDKEDGQTTVRLIFGDAIGEISAPTAILVRTPSQGGMPGNEPVGSGPYELDTGH